MPRNLHPPSDTGQQIEAMTAAGGESLWRLPTVMKRSGLPRSSVYLLVAEGKFPAPIPLEAHRVAWIASEVEAWIAQKIEAGRAVRERSRRSTRKG